MVMWLYFISVHRVFFSLIGEPFTGEEMEEMLSAAIDPEKGYIQYKDYVATMAIEEA